MYYKIQNKASEVYKNLHELRTSELQIQKDNEIRIQEKIGLKWNRFLGHNSQQNLWRVPQYAGFEFTEPDKVDLKVWEKDKKYPEIFVPKKRTKGGREMNQFLSNGLRGSNYHSVFDILKVPELQKFTLPFLEIIGETIILYLGDSQEPKDKNVIEITKKEFESIRSGQ